MPAYSSLGTFIESLRTGRTNITATLESVLADREAIRELDEWPGFRDTANLLDNPIPQWLRTLLKDHGMKDIEVEHIDQHWPPAAKEEARRWIVEAVEEGRPLRFSWELHEGSQPENERREDGERVVFKSPRDGVRISGIHVWYVHIGGVNVER